MKDFDPNELAPDALKEKIKELENNIAFRANDPENDIFFRIINEMALHIALLHKRTAELKIQMDFYFNKIE